MRNQLLAYARVSTKKQSVDQQIDALVGAGVDTDRIVSDVLSGASRDRPGLDALLDYAREGDTIDVVALDRLGRSLSQMVKTIEELQERGVNLRSLREGIDFATATGRLQAAIFSAMAEYERELIKERAAAAREAAAACGREMGRPPALNPSQAETARRRCAKGGSTSQPSRRPLTSAAQPFTGTPSKQSTSKAQAGEHVWVSLPVA